MDFATLDFSITDFKLNPTAEMSIAEVRIYYMNRLQDLRKRIDNRVDFALNF